MTYHARPLVRGEAYPVNKDATKCWGCKSIHEEETPLFRTWIVMREDFVSCGRCIEDGKTPY